MLCAALTMLTGAGAGCDLVAGIGNYCVKGTEGCEGGGGSAGSGGSTTSLSTTSSPQGGGGTGGDPAGGGGTTTSGPPECGNGAEEAGEECDDGNKADADGCEADCTLPKCGNGIADPGELCFTEVFQSFPTQTDGIDELVMVDCDADGDLDVVTSLVTAMKNDGSGQLAELTQSSSLFSDHGVVLSPLGGGAFELVTLGTAAGRTVWLSQDPALPCGFVANAGNQTAGGALDITVLDVNGNGNPDVAKVFTGASSTLHLNLDHEPGTSATTDVTDSLPTSISAGDVVGDSGEDILITATSQDKILILENMAGVYSAPFAILVPPAGVGDQPVDVQAGDLDKDGMVDIVTANLGAGSIAVLRNLGAGTFAAQVPEPKVLGDNGVAAAKPISVALGDVNNDGYLDAVTANSDDASGKSSVSVFLNDGSGKLLLATKASFPLVGADAPFEVGRQPQSVKLGDLNGDGALDIATANAFVDGGTSTVSVLLSNP